jgi:hypothetical protein
MNRYSGPLMDVPAAGRQLVYSRGGHRFGWIAYERLHSCFLLEFSAARLLPAEAAFPEKLDGKWVLGFRNRQLPVFDLVQASGERDPGNAAGYLVVRSRGIFKVCAVDRIGRRFFAPRDIVSSRVQSGRAVSGIRGEVLLRGQRFLVLE